MFLEVYGGNIPMIDYVEKGFEAPKMAVSMIQISLTLDKENTRRR